MPGSNNQTNFTKEVFASRCSVKKVFTEIFQNSQENNCARVSFLIKTSLAKTHHSRPICNSDIAEYGFLTKSLVKTRSMFMGAMQIVLDERSEKEFIKTKIWYDYINHDISLPQNVRLL